MFGKIRSYKAVGRNKQLYICEPIENVDILLLPYPNVMLFLCIYDILLYLRHKINYNKAPQLYFESHYSI